jgi:hypothetical protein
MRVSDTAHVKTMRAKLPPLLFIFSHLFALENCFFKLSPLKQAMYSHNAAPQQCYNQHQAMAASNAALTATAARFCAFKKRRAISCLWPVRLAETNAVIGVRLLRIMNERHR